MKHVAGIDDTYLARWSDAEWRAWQAAMHTAPNSPNPSVPEWMRPIIHENWHHDFSIPFPQVAQLWPSGHDWFAEACVHDDLRLDVEPGEENENPRLAALAAAWQSAKHESWTPLMALTMRPTATGASIVGVIEAFYIVAPASHTDQVHAEMRSHNLHALTTELCGPARDASELLAYAHLPAIPGPVVAWGSEWIY